MENIRGIGGKKEKWVSRQTRQDKSSVVCFGDLVLGVTCREDVLVEFRFVGGVGAERGEVRGQASVAREPCPRFFAVVLTNHRNKGLISVNRRTSLLSHLQYPVPYQSRLQWI